MFQLIPTFGVVGSGSLSCTLLAVPTPSLETVIVKPIGLPATTLAASAVLVTVTCGVPVTQTPALAVALVAFELVMFTTLSRFVA